MRFMAEVTFSACHRLMEIGRFIAGKSLRQSLMAFETELRPGGFQLDPADQTVGTMTIFTAPTVQWLMNDPGRKPFRHFGVTVETAFPYPFGLLHRTGNQR